MASVVNILFDVDTKLHRISVPEGIKKGQRVVVKTENTNEIALVVSGVFEGEIFEQDSKYSFARIANETDLKNEKDKKKNNEQVREQIAQIIKKHNLKLKLIKVQQSFDGSKLLVIYTAPERVDFRELVKELAGTFRTHVEMRQVSDRESACIIGGFAECGQELCCKRFLQEPKISTIKMAKIQDVALNPNKVNGICGKLRCCLSYEYDEYKKAAEKMPALNAKVQTPKGEAVVVYHDLLNEKVVVKFGQEDDVQSFSVDEIKSA